MTLPSREVVAEAAAWITRLHSSRRSPEVEAGLRAWLAADQCHARAFEGMTEIWDATPSMRVESAPAPLPRHLGMGTKIAAACAAAALIVYALVREPAYTTEVGEQRIVNLEDGSRVWLNSGTRVAVEFGESERRIVLKTGEAFFEVAHNASQPFVVLAGGNRVTALGTSFAVRYEESRTAVTLIDGAVAVAAANASQQRTLRPGERLVVTADRAQKVDKPRVEAVTAWRRGEVILDETVLADAVAEMNRYDKTRLVIDDPALAGLPVSGIYRTGDSPGFAGMVARMYGLSVISERGRIHLRR